MAKQERVTRADPLFQAAATGIAATTRQGTTAKPTFPHAFERRPPWPPPGQGALHVQKCSSCTRGGAELHAVAWLHVRVCGAQT
eukprot:8550506-Alexandrium_andersonii.AAC.1